MTDVIILKAIAGHTAGDITPLTDRLQKHVDAGNAKIVPRVREDIEQADGVEVHDGYTTAGPRLTGSGFASEAEHVDIALAESEHDAEADA